MKKDILYIGLAIVVITIVGVIAYSVMEELGYFTSQSDTEYAGAGMFIIPVLKYLWEKVVQLFYLIVTLLLSALILTGIGILFF